MSPSAVPRNSRIAFVLVAIGLATVAGFITWQATTRDRAATATAQAGMVSIAVDGMSCVGCAGAVSATIEEIPGVAEVTVDFENRLAHVRLADQGVDPATLVAAIEHAGYRAHVAPGR